ncbi:formate dehydrogenase major subunit [Desulfitispora alkaliphila]
MTNHWIDYKNSDVIFIIGANPAENHPLSMKWILRAKEERGAKVIVVDPRYTRTSAHADVMATIRPGTNIAFVNGLINYALNNNLYHRDYILTYTNASYIIDKDFDFVDGEFSGLEEVNGKEVYDKSTWKYELDANGEPQKDTSLQHPRSVYQLLKKHVERYGIDKVCEVTGCSKDDFIAVADTFCSTGTAGKAGNLIYAMGITQHTSGTQNVRSLAMLQLLLGNMGIPGGGVNAQRGECNVQGSTDMAMLYHLVPGYMSVPRDHLHPTLNDYIQKETPSSGYWSNKPKFFVSLLKAFYGENATLDNDFGYNFMPKCDEKDHSHQSIFEDTYNGIIKGMFIWGQNPLVGGPNTTYTLEAMKKLDWVVAIDIFETETAAFWRAPGVNPEEVDTEVFMLPACAVYEKEGTVTNSGRWVQWRYQAIDPIGESKSDMWIVDKLFKKVKQLYDKEGGAYPDQITKMNWDYGDDYPDINKIASEINGYDIETGQSLSNFGELKDDGTTMCGNWVYSGYFTNPDDPACKRRDLEAPGGLGLHPNYAFAWPANRRIVYNRCSTDANGRPWDPERALFEYKGGQWEQKDVPDFNASVAPQVSAKTPFIMTEEGVGRLFTNSTNDGPFPEHYEPVESPVKNSFNKRKYMPVANVWENDLGKLREFGDPNYPFIATTYRVTEHYQSGAMTRNTPSLVELVPEMFVEISKELAQEKGISPGEMVNISSPRGEIRARAMITPRVKPLTIGGITYHMIGMPWHWGHTGLSTGDSANKLVPNVGDANTTIPESKAFMCNLTRG